MAILTGAGPPPGPAPGSAAAAAAAAASTMAFHSSQCADMSTRPTVPNFVSSDDAMPWAWSILGTSNIDLASWQDRTSSGATFVNIDIFSLVLASSRAEHLTAR